MPEKDRAKIQLFIPNLYMTGDYTIKGKIMMMPIFGKGISTGNYCKLYYGLPIVVINNCKFV